jgi:dTDP-4-dehydrorhamnose reductase
LKVYVTGCLGLLGVDLMASFRERGHDVAGCDLPQVDITDPAQVVSAVREVAPDVVVHAAAMTDVDGCETDSVTAFAVNARGTRNVAVACQAVDAGIVYIGTDFVFDGSAQRPYREFDVPNPLCVYGQTKLAGEEYVRHLLGKHMVVRTGWLYGPRGRNFVRSILGAARRGRPLSVVNDQVGRPTLSRDLSRAVACLVETGLWGVYHATNSGEASWWSFAVEILRLMGMEHHPVSPIASSELDRPARRPSYSVLDLSCLHATIGEEMRDWREALADFLSDREWPFEDEEEAA